MSKAQNNAELIRLRNENDALRAEVAAEREKREGAEQALRRERAIRISDLCYAQQNMTGDFDVFEYVGNRKVFSNGSEQDCREFVCRNY